MAPIRAGPGEGPTHGRKVSGRGPIYYINCAMPDFEPEALPINLRRRVIIGQSAFPRRVGNNVAARVFERGVLQNHTRAFGDDSSTSVT